MFNSGYDDSSKDHTSSKIMGDGKMDKLYVLLENLDISYQKFEHAPVFTCEQARELLPNLPGMGLKNLFLRDKKGKQHFLVVVHEEKNVNLVLLSEILSVSRLSFASPERLKKYLGVVPGAVSMLALINDSAQAVTVVVDEPVWQETVICCHPLVNHATLALAREDVKSFCDATGHEIKILNVPVK